MIMDTSSTFIATAINLHNLGYNMHFLGQKWCVFFPQSKVALNELLKQVPVGPNRLDRVA